MKATTAVAAALPISGLVGGPLSGWIMQRLAGVAGLHGWQWLRSRSRSQQLKCCTLPGDPACYDP